VASQAQIGSLQLAGYAEATAETEAGRPKATRRKGAQVEGSIRKFQAQGIEFVARPGQAEKLQKAISLAKQDAPETCDGFVGRLVFVSAQEERLVTVVTLWDGTENDKQHDESSEQVKKLLEPFVDRWLRTGKFVTFFSMPEFFAGGVVERRTVLRCQPDGLSLRGTQAA